MNISHRSGRAALPQTILLVEDEALIAMGQASALSKYGYNVKTASDGEEAVSVVVNDTIDLILMDIDLGKGKMDGTKTAEIILRTHDVPIVFLSSHTEPEIVEKTEKITSYGYVVKNAGETVLLASVKMAFNLFETQREREKSERLFHSLFDNMSSGSAVYEVRGDGSKCSDYIIKNFNKVSLELEGKTLEEVAVDHKTSSPE